jgi:hypothetical protein
LSIDLRANLYRISLAYIKKERYTGSCDGLRFFLEKKEAEGEDPVIQVCLWPEPYCFEKTPDDQKHYREFAFSDEGLEQAIDYLSEALK